MKAYGGVEVIAPPFLTLELVGGEWSISLPHPRKVCPVPIGQEAGLYPDLVWALWNKEESLGRDGTRTLAAQSAVPTCYDINTLDAAKATELSKLRFDSFKIQRRQVMD
jgi:hypothetical protein